MLQRFLNKAQILSIDVISGSCLTSYLVATFLNVQLSLSVYLALGLSVWLIYTLDHLIDAYEIKIIAKTERHRFHQKYFKQLAYIWLFVAFVNLVIIAFYLPQQTIRLGLLASVFVVSHVIMVKVAGSKTHFLVQKELSVALNFTIGVMVGPVSYLQNFNGLVLFLFSEIFILALLNLMEFSWYDYEEDKSQNQTSIAVLLGKITTHKIIFFLLVLESVLLAVGLYYFPTNWVQFNLLGMLLVFLALAFFPSYFRNKNRYRLWGDLIFSTPLIFLLLEQL